MADCGFKNGSSLEFGLYKKSPQAKKFKELEDKIADALAFMDACGINSDFNRRLKTVNFWTSVEALLLPFEESVTRIIQQLENITTLQHTLFG